MMNNPKAYHLGDELKRKKICYFIDMYVKRLYGSRHIQSWAAKNKNKTIFDVIKISDLAYTVAVVENSHEIWEKLLQHRHLSGDEGQHIWEGEREESSTKKTPKFTN